MAWTRWPPGGVGAGWSTRAAAAVRRIRLPRRWRARASLARRPLRRRRRRGPASAVGELLSAIGAVRRAAQRRRCAVDRVTATVREERLVGRAVDGGRPPPLKKLLTASPVASPQPAPCVRLPAPPPSLPPDPNGWLWRAPDVPQKHSGRRPTRRGYRLPCWLRCHWYCAGWHVWTGPRMRSCNVHWLGSCGAW